jgi:hypothetical protein
MAKGTVIVYVKLDHPVVTRMQNALPGKNRVSIVTHKDGIKVTVHTVLDWDLLFTDLLNGLETGETSWNKYG